MCFTLPMMCLKGLCTWIIVVLNMMRKAQLNLGMEYPASPEQIFCS